MLNALRREFELLEMKKGETVDSYFGRVNTVSNKLRSNGDNISDLKIVGKILRTMSEEFTYVKEEEPEDEQVLKVEQTSYDRGRGRFSSRGRGRGGRGGRGAFNKATVECYKCHGLGHFQYECSKWNKETNFAEIDENEEEVLLMAYTEGVQANGKKRTWFIDSGCSNHMCNDAEMFTTMDSSFNNYVKLGNNRKMAVSELKNNLLSVGQLQEKGLSVMFAQDNCKIYHPVKGLIIQTQMSSNRMFIVNSKTRSLERGEKECLQTTATDLSKLWHQRYGHLSYEGLHTLQEKRMVQGLPNFKAEKLLCVDCLSGKQTRKAILHQSSWRADHILELVYADLCGPITLPSSSGKKYFLSIIDDHNRKGWIYLLTCKSEAFDHFKKFRNMVEKETSMSIKCFRSDRGGEFNSTEFNTYCEDNGIKRQLTNAYTPQQNGVAERRNRTIMNMVRSLLSAKKMPKYFWSEAAVWTCHILNRCPTLSVKDVTPQEKWSKVKPTVDHLRIWGCLAHAHVPKQSRSKLDERSTLCIFIGIYSNTKAYRLYDVKGEKLIISRDVVFEEDKHWKWGTGHKQQIENELEWNDINAGVEVTEQPVEDDQPVFDDQGDINEENSSDSSSNGGNTAGNSSTNEVNAANSYQNGGNTSSSSSTEHNTSSSSEDSPVQRRTHRAPRWMEDYTTGEGLSSDEVNMVQDMGEEDPFIYEEAAKHEKWRTAMKNEMESIEKNKTWTLTSLPKGSKMIGVKWIYKTKRDGTGNVIKCKARLVAKGYSQKHGIEFNEVFALVARLDTIRLIIGLAPQKGWKLFQLDVKSAFLQGELDEEVFVAQPQGYTVKGKEDQVYKLHKALYGLKQAPRAWYSKIENYFVKENFQKCSSEQTWFTKRSGEGKIIIVSVYVDDLIYTGNDDQLITEFKRSMLREFDMTNLGNMSYFLRIEVKQSEKGVFINQRKYAEEVLRRFGMMECNSVNNPIAPGVQVDKDPQENAVDETLFKQIVGSMMYLTATRPDLMYVTSLISRYMARPTEVHMQIAKRALRYVKGTTQLGIYYQRTTGMKGELLTYIDSNYAGDLDDRRSTSGYAFIFSSSAVAWSSKKQPIVTLSTTEAEFVAAAFCTCQAFSTIKLSKNSIMHGMSKHIDVRFHFSRDLSKEGRIELQHCGTSDQVADIMIKPLKLEAFLKLRTMLGMKNITEVN
ncbi:transmembrane signal receptor [Lithospermum erythrorhizon]|uniref:Transmembrane signal receptor n=1 Tax=Lithospermum erythrorhizon TaxID=34254 RepID=A0AAV3QGA6_LITER